jgi:hypothetical protein
MMEITEKERIMLKNLEDESVFWEKREKDEGELKNISIPLS